MTKADLGAYSTPRLFNGMAIMIAPAWVTRTESGWRRFVQPPVPPRGRRKGTRRQWKKAHPQGWRLRSWQIEVDDHPILTTGDKLFMTARTERRLRAMIASAHASPAKEKTVFTTAEVVAMLAEEEALLSKAPDHD